MIVIALAIMLVLSTPANAESGVASVYSTRSPDQPGTVVACPGHKLNDGHLVAAHKTLPCGSKVTVTNKANGKSVTVTIIDRGPYVRGRVIDLSVAAARSIGISGLGHVELAR